MAILKKHNAIVSSDPAVDVDPEVDIEIEVNPRATCGVYLLLCMVGMSANLATNTLWIQLPVLIAKLPEGHDLPLYMLVLWELGNLSAMVYLLARKCSRTGTNDSAPIYTCIFLNITTIALLGFFWDRQVFLFEESHSLTVIICMVVMGQMCGLAGVTYIPYTAGLKAGYITSVLLGDCFAALLPHALSIGEGLATSPDCKPDPSANFNRTTFIYRVNRQHTSTTPMPPTPPKLRFPEYVYFYSMCGVTLISCMCFLILRYVPSLKFEYEQVRVDCMDDVELTGSRGPGAIEDNDCRANNEGGAYVLDDGSVRGTLRQDGVGNRSRHPSPHRSQVQFRNKTGTSLLSSSQASSTEHKVPSFLLLMAITWWASAVTYGPLSSVKAHSCLPVGNMPFFIGTLLTNGGAAITCLIVLKLSPRLKVTLVVAFTCLGTILLTYFVALIAFSHQSESREDSPIFGNFGELLATVGWAAIVGLFFFARAAIAVICRNTGPEYMMWYACMTQLGSTIGTLGLWRDISICQVYKSYEQVICADI